MKSPPVFVGSSEKELPPKAIENRRDHIRSSSLETLKRRFAFSSLSIFPTSTSPLQPSSFYFFSFFSSFSTGLFDSFTWPRYHRLFRCNDISIQFEPHLRCWGWKLVVYRVCTCPSPSHSLSFSLSSPRAHPHPHLGGWHVAHYVICPLDQSTCGAHFFPASLQKKGRTKKSASGITPVAADQSPYVKRHFLWAPLGLPARSVCVIKIDLSFFLHAPHARL